MRPLRLVAAALLATACADDPVVPPEPQPEPRIIVNSEAEPAGAHCVHGGTAVRSGIDDDVDGVLDAAEVDDVTYACDPAPVPTQMVRTRPEAAGVNCPSGGTAVETGADADFDGALGDDEVTATTYACEVGELFEGDAIYADWLTPVDLARLREATIITGDLTISAEGVASLPRLRTVTGELTVRPSTDGLDLPALATVGGDLDLQAAGLAGDVELPALTHVGGAARLGGGDDLTGLALPALTTLGGGLVLGAWDDDALLEVPALTTVGGAVLAREAPAAALQLTALRTVGGGLQLDGSATTAVSLPALRSVALTVDLAGDALASVHLPALRTTGGFDVRAPLLTELRLPALTHAGDTFRLTAPALTVLEVPALTHIGGDPDTDAGQGLRVNDTSLRELAAPALRTVSGGILVMRSPQLSAVRLPALAECPHMHIVLPALTAFEAPALAALEYLNLEGPVATLALDALREVRRHLDIRETALVDLRGLPRLASAGELTLLDNPALASLRGLAALDRLGTLELRGNTSLATLDGLQRLGAISERVDIEQNPALTTLTGLDGIVATPRLFLIGNGLTSLDGLGHLRTVDIALYIEGNRALTSLAGLARLARVGALRVEGNPLVPADEIAALRARLGL